MLKQSKFHAKNHWQEVFLQASPPHKCCGRALECTLAVGIFILTVDLKSFRHEDTCSPPRLTIAALCTFGNHPFHNPKIPCSALIFLNACRVFLILSREVK